MELDSLPQEVLVRIFQLLPVSCRNQVRLVNKEWSSLCYDPFITKEEILNILPSNRLSTIPDVFSTLMSSNRSIFNLKLRGSKKCALFSEENFTSDFWLKYGTKIRYLNFFPGDSDTHDLVRVLECCPNLIELHCHAYTDQADFVDVLNILINKNVILKKVTCLSLDIPFKKGPLKEILLKVFPNARNLYLCLKCPIENPHDISSDVHDYLLKISSNLKCLHLSSNSFWHGPKPLIQKVVTNILAAAKKLKTLELRSLRFLTRQHMLQLSALNDLTTLKIHAIGTELSACEFLVQILDIVPKLHHLEFVVCDAFGQINDKVVNKLSTSSLQTLIIHCRPYIKDIRMCGGVNVSQYEPNDTLEKLSWILGAPDDERAAEDVAIFFLKYFRKLKCLFFSPQPSSAALEVLRSHQANLKSLSLVYQLGKHSSMISNGDLMDTSVSDLNEYPVFQWFSFGQFKYLEKLTLQIELESWFSSQQYSFSDFILPQLKYLLVKFFSRNYLRDRSESIICPVPSNLIDFLHAIEKLPRLEYLKLQGHEQNIPYDLARRQCESHQNLRFLILSQKNTSIYYDRTKYHSAELRAEISKLFTICESLRFVYYDRISLRKNVCTNEIQSSKEEIYKVYV